MTNSTKLPWHSWPWLVDENFWLQLLSCWRSNLRRTQWNVLHVPPSVCTDSVGNSAIYKGDRGVGSRESKVERMGGKHSLLFDHSLLATGHSPITRYKESSQGTQGRVREFIYRTYTLAQRHRSNKGFILWEPGYTDASHTMIQRWIAAIPRLKC